MAEKRPVSEIMATLKTDGPALIKENVALAKAEIKPAVKHACLLYTSPSPRD